MSSLAHDPSESDFMEDEWVPPHERRRRRLEMRRQETLKHLDDNDNALNSLDDHDKFEEMGKLEYVRKDSFINYVGCVSAAPSVGIQ